MIYKNICKQQFSGRRLKETVFNFKPVAYLLDRIIFLKET